VSKWLADTWAGKLATELLPLPGGVTPVKLDFLLNAYTGDAWRKSLRVAEIIKAGTEGEWIGEFRDIPFFGAYGLFAEPSQSIQDIGDRVKVLGYEVNAETDLASKEKIEHYKLTKMSGLIWDIRKAMYKSLSTEERQASERFSIFLARLALDKKKLKLRENFDPLSPKNIGVQIPEIHAFFRKTGLINRTRLPGTERYPNLFKAKPEDVPKTIYRIKEDWLGRLAYQISGKKGTTLKGPHQESFHKWFMKESGVTPKQMEDVLEAHYEERFGVKKEKPKGFMYGLTRKPVFGKPKSKTSLSERNKRLKKYFEKEEK